MYYQRHFRHICQLFIGYFVFSFLLLFASRYALYLHIEPGLPVNDIVNDIQRAFMVGARFDAKVTAIAYAPLLLVGLVCAAFSQAYLRWLSLSTYYHAVIVLLYIIGGVGNYYYYLTYGSHIDLFIFGLMDDDSVAVLTNLWVDYPVIYGVSLALVMAGIGYYFARYLTRLNLWSSQQHWHWSITSLAVVFMMVGVFLLARGSTGSLPLKRYHASVSAYQPLNMITPNAFMALDWARSDYTSRAHLEPISQQVLQQQMQKLLGQPDANYKTPHNDYLADHPPHVVIAMMESMGLSVLIEDDPTTNDLLGRFREHYRHDFLFERFLAGTSATIDSIVMMLVHSPLATISHSNWQKIPLPSSAVLPYQRAGYDVVFVYGGNGMWRNLANYLPTQGFDRVYDENDIVGAFPLAAQYAGTWGVPDEFMFKFTQQLLDKAERPTLIYVMTVTNHSPYRVPAYYQPKPTTLTPRLQEMLGYKGNRDAQELLKTFQYASDAVGQFISDIKQSSLSDQVIMAVTGDNLVRYNDIARPGEAGLTHAVPFYLYVPPSILAHTEFNYQPERIGSHRDIFPTLYHFSLSDQAYVSLGGENLLTIGEVSNIGFNSGMSINAYGAVSNHPPFIFHPWQGDESLLTEPQASDEQTFDRQWGLEYHRLQEYFLRSQVLPMTP